MQDIVGYVCGTATTASRLVASAMKTHDPEGSTWLTLLRAQSMLICLLETLCIHSVCVHQSHLRKGFGLRLLKAYVETVAQGSHFDRVLLICKQHLIGFYTRAGFVLEGPSAVQHGAEQWFDMHLRTPADAPQA